MNRAHTQVQRQTKTIQPLPEFRTAVSLHSHTLHSKENLNFFPHYIEFLRTNFITKMVQSGLDRYKEINGHSLDFSRAYWTPPVTPGMVLASETKQIERKLNLASIVSITDHDTIDGPLHLHEEPAAASTPVSVEWTVPFGGSLFHIGIHHLPADRAPEIMKELGLCTAEPTSERICDLLSLLNHAPDTLLVFNHPLQNISWAERGEYFTTLNQFLTMCRPWIHGLEFNGMRSITENQDVLRMAEECNLPVIAGGDRHGARPNTVLNLSHEETWSDFVASIREERRNAIVSLPAYEEPAPLRELATAGDVLRHYPKYPYGRRRFTDRLYFNLEGYGWHPLSYYWDGGRGKPMWLSPAVAAVIALGSEHLRPILGWFLSRPAQFDCATFSLGEENPAADLGAREEEVTVGSD